MNDEGLRASKIRLRLNYYVEGKVSTKSLWRMHRQLTLS